MPTLNATSTGNTATRLLRNEAGAFTALPEPKVVELGYSTEDVAETAARPRLQINNWSAPSASNTPEQASLDFTQIAVKHVDGSLDRVVGEEVIIQCSIGEQEYSIRLPLSLVPEELRAIGQPVRISLIDRYGYRYPLVEKRDRKDIPLSPDMQSLLEEIDQL